MSKNAFIKFKTLLVIFCIAAAAALILYYSGVFQKPTQPAQNSNSSQNSGQQQATSTSPGVSASASSTSSVFTAPISNWQQRVTKKPFGIYITPQNSPVQPERFTGYHTGVDFETFPNEQNIDVPVYAICSGQLLFKGFVSGYGGVMVQSCKLDSQDITVLFGHLKLASITLAKGDQISAGDKIGILGKGYSQETDGERKHLHLGIHKGTAINFTGYVQNQAELNNWIDITKYLK